MKSSGRFTRELRKLVFDLYNVCSRCGSVMPRDVAAYAGYDADEQALYVGECCSRHVSELASHMYWWWHLDKRCDPTSALWRYMDFAKFVSLIERGELFFARADSLGDPFEGAAGMKERQHILDEHNLGYFRDGIRNPPDGYPPPSEDIVELEAARLLAEFRHLGEVERRQTFVSCWHSNEGESEALWRLYCPPPVVGVAIQTTVADLYGAMDFDPLPEVGRVHYIDFRNGIASPYDRIFFKRRSLSHEAEVRAVVKMTSAPETLSGIGVRVDLPSLVRAVVPSPFAGRWFAELVETTCRRAG